MGSTLERSATVVKPRVMGRSRITSWSTWRQWNQHQIDY